MKLREIMSSILIATIVLVFISACSTPYTLETLTTTIRTAWLAIANDRTTIASSDKNIFIPELNF